MIQKQARKAREEKSHLRNSPPPSEKNGDGERQVEVIGFGAGGRPPSVPHLLGNLEACLLPRRHGPRGFFEEAAGPTYTVVDHISEPGFSPAAPAYFRHWVEG